MNALLEIFTKVHTKSNLCSYRILKKNDEVIRYEYKKNKADKIYFVIDGTLIAECEFEYSRNKFSSLVTETQVFGLESFVLSKYGSPPINYALTAITDSVILEINSEYFLDHLYSNPKLYHEIFSDTIKRYFLLAQSYQNSHQPPMVKVIYAFVNIMKILDLQPDCDNKITFPRYINQKFLSKYIQSSESNISIAVNYLEKQKLIQKKPFILLKEKDLLMYLSKLLNKKEGLN
ncbi:MAG: Crp/Fnr family transcriptional regulator [Carnobacterium maltaromaticum]